MGGGMSTAGKRSPRNRSASPVSTPEAPVSASAVPHGTPTSSHRLASTPVTPSPSEAQSSSTALPEVLDWVKPKDIHGNPVYNIPPRQVNAEEAKQVSQEAQKAIIKTLRAEKDPEKRRVLGSRMNEMDSWGSSTQDVRYATRNDQGVFGLMMLSMRANQNDNAVKIEDIATSHGGTTLARDLTDAATRHSMSRYDGIPPESRAATAEPRGRVTLHAFSGANDKQARLVERYNALGFYDTPNRPDRPTGEMERIGFAPPSKAAASSSPVEQKEDKQ